MTDRDSRPTDQTTVLVAHAAQWSRQRRSILGKAAGNSDPSNPDTNTSDDCGPPAETLLPAEAGRSALYAARYAMAAYPGPIGELISRELHGYVEAGVRAEVPALAPRLVLALQRAEARHPMPEIRDGWAHLPARYIPGSPMHWRYRTSDEIAEEPQARDTFR